MTSNDKRCSGQVFNTPGDLVGYRCGKRGSITEDGKLFCAKCSPTKRRERENVSRRPQWAMEVCRELIYGAGTADSTQRAIDLARIALGEDPMPDEWPKAWKPVKEEA